jgi:hypothetical protein
MNEIAAPDTDIDRGYDRDWLAVSASAIGLMLFACLSALAAILAFAMPPVPSSTGRKEHLVSAGQ